MQTLLDCIQNPGDLKTLSVQQLPLLCKDIRKHLVTQVSKTGGHLSSNLGVVELSVALHYVFDSPVDKFIWDVGHQSYTHKILTGRKEALGTIRQYKGLSGFPKKCESAHDVFETGHSSTSISAALGMAAARDIKNETHSVVAIIGDGALTGGMAYEAMNNAGHLKSNLIVVLNDNQMSISKNVGGMALYLDSLRTASTYKTLKDDAQRFIKHIPKVGEGLFNVASSLKNSIKQLLVPGMFFEELGFTYLGPIDGNQVDQLVTVLNQAKNVEGPVLIHIKTKKGKGYSHAENNPSKFHGTKPFDLKSGESAPTDNSQKSYSEVVGQHLCELAKTNEKIVAITAAMAEGTGLKTFQNMYLKRFFDVGIAEQHAVTFAAGLASDGLRPVFAVYSTFLQRAYDQVLHDVCIQKLPVVFGIDRADLVGDDGETHQGIFDISYLSSMPEMTILAPIEEMEVQAAFSYALSQTEGPVAIRYPRGNVPNIVDKFGLKAVEVKELEENFRLGKMRVMKEGTDVAIIFIGNMWEIAYELEQLMFEQGITPTLVNGCVLKPIDIETITRLARTHKDVVILEEHILTGGFGSEVIRLVHNQQLPLRIHNYGIEDQFVTHGPRKVLIEQLGIDAQSIWSDLKVKL